MPDPSPSTVLHLPPAQRVFTPANVPMPDPPWRPLGQADVDRLHHADIYAQVSENHTPIDHLVQRDLPARPWQEFWIALVPGSSEARGHHAMWTPQQGDDPDARVEPEFVSRLHHAYRLLDEGIVRYVVISGGSVDPQHTDYNEGRRGREEFLRRWGDAFHSSAEARGDALADRVIVDPWAIHSTANVRNCDRLCALLGLDRNLIVTTQVSPYGWPFRWLPVFQREAAQGYYFTDPNARRYLDQHARREVGYTLGSFRMLDQGPDGGNVFGTGAADNPGVAPDAIPTEVILHWELNRPRLLTDAHWD